MEVVSDDNWSYKMCKTPVKSSSTNQQLAQHCCILMCVCMCVSVYVYMCVCVWFVEDENFGEYIRCLSASVIKEIRLKNLTLLSMSLKVI